MPDERATPEPSDAPKTPADPYAGPATRRTFASARACIVVGIIAVVADVAILRSAGRPWGASIAGGLFVGVFTGYGLWLVTKTRRAIRPVDENPAERDPSRPPPAGGWANPSGGQKAMGFVSRTLDALLPRRRR